MCRIFFITVALFFSNLLFSQQANRLYEEGISKMEKGDFRGAIHSFTNVLNGNISFFQANLERGKCYEEIGKIDSAFIDYQTAINKNANYAKSFYYRGKLYHKQKDYKKAIADFSKSISIRDNVADAWYWRGLTYFETAEWQKAIDDFTKLISLDSKHKDGYYYRALCLTQLKRNSEAISDLNKVLSFDNSYKIAYFQRAICYENENQNEKAINDYTKAISLGLSSVEVHKKRMRIAFLSKRWKLVIEDANKLIFDFKDKSTQTLSYRADAYMSTADYTPAIKDYTKLIQLDRNNYDAYLKKAECHRLMNKIPMALSELRKASNLQPKSHEAFLEMGKILFEQKKYQESIDNLNKA